MKCVCCGKRINPKRDRHQYVHDQRRRKRCACAECANTGRFDEWVTANRASLERKQDENEVEWLVECGCCGCYHRPDYLGDCRNDAERFPVPYLPYPGFTPKTA